MATNKNPTTESLPTIPHRLLNVRMFQNFHLVWLDGYIDETNENYHNSITKLQELVHTVNTFVNVDECIDFVTDIGEKAFVIISEEFGPNVISIVQNISQVHFVYIFHLNNVSQEKWLKQWPNVASGYTNIVSICEALEKAIRDYDHNSISISFLKKTDEATSQNLDTLDSSFMYTQILKEILLTIDFDPGHVKKFLTYCREQFANNIKKLAHVDMIEKEYRQHRSIWWYTYPSFLYSMLNKALRTMDGDIIVRMGFFIQDIHNHITELHTEQYGGNHHCDSFTVYRGQGLSSTEFDQMKSTQGGLLAFNNFLSTSCNENVSLRFALDAINSYKLVGVLFVIKIHPSIFTTPFAAIKNVSYFQQEEEVLFSMHSVFRISQIKQHETNDRLWKVDLTLTSDNDPQLQTLTTSIHRETAASTGWLRLGKLMITVAQFNTAQQVFDFILDKSSEEMQKLYIYDYVGYIKYNQGQHTEALSYYEKAFATKKTHLPANHHDLATSYNNIGMVCYGMGVYSKALSYYEKALEIQEKILPANHPELSPFYNNIGMVYSNMGQYSKALSYYEKVLEIQEKTLPANHPHLATSYGNIGTVYSNMGQYSKALSSLEKALEIFEKALPANHFHLATSYSNIGTVCFNMGQYSKALSSLGKTLEIFEKTLPTNHPHLATSYNNIGLIYFKMGQYSKALSSHEKALQIFEKALPANHPELAISYGNIGSMYSDMGQYSKALSYHEKALEIFEKTLPTNHPDLATSYNNIGLAYSSMGEYSKALSSHGKALEIQEKTLPANHPHLATSYSNIGMVYFNMGQYSKALSSLGKALEIFEKTLPTNHPHLATSYNNIGLIYFKMGQYSKALSAHEKALEIKRKNASCKSS